MAQNAPRCEGCDWPVCHPACQGLKDPNVHAHECLILGLRAHSALDGLHEYYRQDTLLALRCLMLQRKGIKKWLQLLEMEAHMTNRGPGTEIHKEVDERVVTYIYDNFIIPLKALEEHTGNTVLPDLSKETLHQICGIIDVNALEINQNDAEVSAIYDLACLMEHSCVANTAHIFEFDNGSYKITVRAATPIKKGEHITTMYTHALWGTQARREHLRETKYFDCKCLRCSDPTELGTYFSALKCLGTELVPCGGVQLPLNPLDDATEWACNKCDVKLSNNDVSYLVNQIGEEVDHVQLSNPTVRELDNLLNKMTTFLHPNHYHCYAVKHSLVQLYGYQQGYLPNQIPDETLKSKSRMCRELLETTQKIDPGNSRLPLYAGVLLHELHLSNVCFVKRKWHVGIKSDNIRMLQEARKALEEAKVVLSHEINTASGEKLNQLIRGSEKDFARWLDRSKIDLDKEIADLDKELKERKIRDEELKKETKEEPMNVVHEEPKKVVKEEPKIEVKEEPKQEVKEEPKQEATVESKTEKTAKLESNKNEHKKEDSKIEDPKKDAPKKEEPKETVKEETKVDVKAELKTDPKEESKPVVKDETKAKDEPKAEPKKETKPKTKPVKKEVKPEAKKEDVKKDFKTEVKEETKEKPSNGK